jgi:hypothetical protein
MAVTKPPLTPASPGQPVTAQGWNELVNGLSALYDEVIAFGGATLEIGVVFSGAPVAGAQVTAEPLGDGRAAQAIPPFGSRTTYLLAGLTTGNWRIHVQAAGFSRQTRDVTLPREEPLVIELLREGFVVVPKLFGIGLRGALTALTGAGLEVDLIFDTTGRELPRATIPPEYDAAPVLVATPDVGAVVPSTTRLRLVVASALRRDPVVTMPSLIGLTLDEAKLVVERLGLRVGETTVRSST